MYLHASIEDDIMRASKRQMPVYTKFFNMAEQKSIEDILKKNDEIKYLKMGGYEGAERCIFKIYPIFIDYDIFDEVPIKVLRITWNGKYYKIGHRDILGAVLGLGIKREVVGDIIIEDEQAYVFVLAEIASFIMQNLIKVGAASVRIKCLNITEVDIEPPEAEVINAVVPSLRLDCIASAGFRTSRSQIASMIKAGRVLLNWETCAKPGEQIESGDVITIRGRGRIIYRDILRRTKKDRLFVEIERYV